MARLGRWSHLTDTIRTWAPPPPPPPPPRSPVSVLYTALLRYPQLASDVQSRARNRHSSSPSPTGSRNIEGAERIAL